MNYEVSIRRKAELDIAEAQDWYEQEAGLSQDFWAEVQNTVKVLRSTPLIYQEVYRGLRRAILHRFPYFLWYKTTGNHVLIVACTHAKIGPESLEKSVS